MEKKTEIFKICKNCSHWFNKQAELNYTTLSGFCVRNSWSPTGTAQVMVLDRGNVKNLDGVGNPAQKIEGFRSRCTPERLRYALVTDEDYGCVKFEVKGKQDEA